MGWDQKDAVGEILEEGDRVKIFRYSRQLEQDIIGEHVGEIAKVGAIECENYSGCLQIGLGFDDGECGWAHQSSVMKV